ncbi:hypothetical protein PHLH8_25990 [Pseudomonas sp. Pc102]|uniref:hypothetical protein n=1 Tax=Pseudomonas sp. Pc102 TaxID=2678261 RepID=UPI001BCCFB76|nr:hypothetical protein [Pseudomonas sp. Pc102]BBP82957.1 hypothetical protein PHLH8_25990 [Pseudomonas sp. Pc102]
MARVNLILASTAIAAVTAAATLYWRLSAEAQVTTQPAPRATQAPAYAASDAPETTGAPRIDPARMAEYEKRLEFHAAYRDFFKAAPGLSAEAREQQAARLAEEVQAHEQSGELAASESLMLQIALIQATSTDVEEQKARANALLQRYKARSDALEKKLAAKPSPQFDHYKQEEKRIVEEVLAMQSIPDGLSRDEYLRQRLQQAREQAYH